MLDVLDKYVPEPPPTFDAQTIETCCIMDSMAAVQACKYGGCKSFGELSDRLSNILLKNFEIPGCHGIDAMFDRYDMATGSIKADERSQRGAGGGIRQEIAGPQTQISLKWGKFISETENKRIFVRFLEEYWIDNVPDQLNDNQQLVIAGGTNDPSSAILVESNRVANVRSLCCSHEEADTQIIFHAAAAIHAGFERVIVISPDTDVLILLVHFARQVGGEILLKLSKGDRVFPAHIIA